MSNLQPCYPEPPADSRTSATKGLAQPRYRLAAEFDPIQGILATWSSWRPECYEYIHQIVRAAAAVTEVYLLVEDAALEQRATAILKGDPAIDLSRIHFIQAKTETDWMRNYGPFGALDEGGNVTMLDAHAARYWRRDEDQAPLAIASAMGLSRVELPLIQDGGNTMSDGRGTFFFTQITYAWNGHAEYLARGLRMKWGAENGCPVRSISEIRALITQ